MNHMKNLRERTVFGLLDDLWGRGIFKGKIRLVKEDMQCHFKGLAESTASGNLPLAQKEICSTHPQITPSAGGNGTGSVVMKACPVQGCLCGARISTARQYSASLWYEVIFVIRGVIGATTLARDRQSCMPLARRYVEAFIPFITQEIRQIILVNRLV